MTVFGYTLAFIGALFGGCLSVWAILMGFQSLFPHRSSLAKEAIVSHPWRWAIVGLVVWMTIGLFGFALLQAPNPLAKFVGTIWISVLLAFSAVGGSGLLQLMGSRLKEKDATMSEYASQSRAGIILVTAGLIPFVGWFAVIPTLLSISLGSGLRAVLTRKRAETIIEAGV